MSTELTTIAGPVDALPQRAERVDAGLAANILQWSLDAAGAIAGNTERALRADTRVWLDWCEQHAERSLPAAAATVRRFIDDMVATRAPATVRRYVATIAAVHRAAQAPDPTKDEQVRLALKRMMRGRGARQKQATPITHDVATKMLAAAGNGSHGARDRALLLVAYDTLCRRSELVALQVADIQHDEDGSGSVLVRRSKGDQNGEGSVRYLAPQTVQAVRDWLDVAQIADGGVFRALGRAGMAGEALTPQDVTRIMRRLCAGAGVELAGIGGHSTRVGAAQDMVAAGLEVGEIMQAGGWKTPVMVARYAERLSVRRGAAAKLARAQGRANNEPS